MTINYIEAAIAMATAMLFVASAVTYVMELRKFKRPSLTRHNIAMTIIWMIAMAVICAVLASWALTEGLH
jgi:hypothetical protein